VDIKDKPVGVQKQQLDQTLENWMAQANERQIDDICVMGVRL
jgi:hypothetical protein